MKRVVLNSLIVALALVFASTAAHGQYVKKHARKGIYFEIPANSNDVESMHYTVEWQNTQYGNFAVNVVELNGFYGNDPEKLQWIEALKKDKKRWKKLDETSKTVLRNLTVLDDLNPVHFVDEQFTTVNGQEVLEISFKKNTPAGLYVGKCIGYLVPQKGIYVKAVHYAPEEYFDRETKKRRDNFFNSMQVKR